MILHINMIWRKLMHENTQQYIHINILFRLSDIVERKIISRRSKISKGITKFLNFKLPKGRYETYLE